MNGAKRQKISETKEVDNLFTQLINIINYDITQTCSDILATGHGINEALKSFLGDSAHIIHPDASSVHSLASSDKNDSLQGAIAYTKMISGYETNGESISNGFINKDGGSLKKPVVMIVNTESIKVKTENDVSVEGGNHWQCCIILPKKYKPKFGEELNNKDEIVFYLDSFYTNIKIPEIFKSLLMEGLIYSFTSEEKTYIHKIPASFPNAIIVDGITTKQQEDGKDCGWWALYNTLMLVATGKVDYLQQFKQPSREIAYKLRTIFPNLGRQVGIGLEREINIDEIDSEEFLAIQAAIEASLKGKNENEMPENQSVCYPFLDSPDAFFAISLSLAAKDLNVFERVNKFILSSSFSPKEIPIKDNNIIDCELNTSEEKNKKIGVFWLFYRGLISYLILEDYANALSNFDRAIKLIGEEYNPEFVTKIKFQGFKLIEDNLKSCFFLQPTVSDIYFCRGKLKKQIKDNSYRSDFAQAYYLRGLTFSFYGRHFLAIEQYNQSIEFNATSYTVYYQIAHSYWCSGNLKSALENYEKVINEIEIIGINSKPYLYLESLKFRTEIYFLNGDFELLKKDTNKFMNFFQKEENLVVKLIIHPEEKMECYGLYFQVCTLRCRVHSKLNEYKEWFIACNDLLNLDSKVTPETATWVELAPEISKQAENFLIKSLKSSEKKNLKEIILIIENAYGKAIQANTFILTLKEGPEFISYLQSKPEVMYQEKALQSYIMLFTYYLYLITEPSFSVCIDIEHFKEKALNLLNDIKKHKGILGEKANRLAEFAESSIKFGSINVSQGDFKQQIEYLESQAQSIHPKSLNMPSINSLLLIYNYHKNQLNPLTTPYFVKTLQQIQKEAFLELHEIKMQYFSCKIKIIRAYFNLAKTQPQENIYELIKNKYVETLTEIEIYHIHINNAEKTEIKNFKQGSLKKIYYELYQLKIDILLEQMDIEKENKSYHIAKELCLEANTLLTKIKALKLNESISSWYEKSMIPNYSLEMFIDILNKIKEKETIINNSNLEIRETNLKRKYEELRQKVETDELTVFYGKEDALVTIPFPYNIDKGTIRKTRATGEIRNDANLAIVSIGLLYSLPLSSPSSKPEKCFGYLRININDKELEYENVAACTSINKLTHPYWKAFTDAIMERIDHGKSLAKEYSQTHPNFKFLFLDDQTLNQKFEPNLHLHSEQHFFESLNKLEIREFMKNFMNKNPNFTPGCKVHVITFDIETEYTSCSSCKLAEVAMQHPVNKPNYFLSKLQQYLKNNNHSLAGAKKGNELLWSVTRICASKQYKQINHKNPVNRNLKKLENFGIFENINPTVFASGSEKNLLKK